MSLEMKTQTSGELKIQRISCGPLLTVLKTRWGSTLLCLRAGWITNRWNIFKKFTLNWLYILSKSDLILYVCSLSILRPMYGRPRVSFPVVGKGSGSGISVRVARTENYVQAGSPMSYWSTKQTKKPVYPCLHKTLVLF